MMICKKTVLTLAVLLATQCLSVATYASPASTSNKQVPTPKTLADVQREFHGGNPLNPAAGSLLRRFLDETHNSSRVRTFPNAPTNSENPPYRQGAQKLALALGPESMSAFTRIFNSKNYFFIYHTPMSHTFHFIYRGHSGSYAQLDAEAPTFNAQSTILVPILLSDSEADRLVDYLRITASGVDYTLASSPWLLQGPNGPYSATSEFFGCTHWVGQLPLGDELVNEYYFPSGPNDATGEHPNVAPLQQYDDVSGLNADQNAAIRRVWTVPGHKQLGEILDPMAMRRGEFANVGWITYTALGNLGVDRAPAMFYEVNDATQSLNANFPLNIDAAKR